MSFLEIPSEAELPEQAPAKAGEHPITILGAERRQGTSKKGEPFDQISVTLHVEDEPDAKLVYHTVWLPREGDTEEATKSALRRIRYFLQAFSLELGIDLDNLDAWVGAQGFAILDLEQSEEYGDRNRVKRFVTPK